MGALKWLGKLVGNTVAMILGIAVFLLLIGGALWVINEQDKLTGGPGIVTTIPSKEDRLKKGLTLIATYCQYGAVSGAQLSGCYYHAHVEEIEGRTTNAAMWARGELDECLSDSGPFCSEGYRKTIEHRIENKQIPASILEEQP